MIVAVVVALALPALFPKDAHALMRPCTSGTSTAITASTSVQIVGAGAGNITFFNLGAVEVCLSYNLTAPCDAKMVLPAQPTGGSSWLSLDNSAAIGVATASSSSAVTYHKMGGCN